MHGRQYYFSNEQKTFLEASLECSDFDSQLLSIHSERENEVVLEIMKKYQNIDRSRYVGNYMYMYMPFTGNAYKADLHVQNIFRIILF